MQKGNASLRKFVLGASRAGAQCRESGLDRRGGPETEQMKLQERGEWKTGNNKKTG